MIEGLTDSGLRGMGGAGFPTGRKWELVRAEPSTPKYVVCNADESEPGAFKDRVILEELPHLVIEGMALGALAIGAERGWIYIRHEYQRARDLLQKAIDAAYAAGVLGNSVCGSDLRFDLKIFVSPGGYILCTGGSVYFEEQAGMGGETWKGTPEESKAYKNLMAMFETGLEYGKYPIKNQISFKIKGIHGKQEQVGDFWRREERSLQF